MPSISHEDWFEMAVTPPGAPRSTTGLAPVLTPKGRLRLVQDDGTALPLELWQRLQAAFARSWAPAARRRRGRDGAARGPLLLARGQKAGLPKSSLIKPVLTTIEKKWRVGCRSPRSQGAWR